MISSVINNHFLQLKKHKITIEKKDGSMRLGREIDRLRQRVQKYL